MNLCISSRLATRYVLIALLTTASLSAGASDAVSKDDPLESMNRSIFGFNELMDKYALKPVAKELRFCDP